MGRPARAGVRGGGASSLLRVAQWTTGPGANNHYYLRASVAASWAQAEAFAVAFGGHLVSIGSAEENNFVAGNLGAFKRAGSMGEGTLQALKARHGPV